MPQGAPGVRFLNVAFSENSPAELAILINTTADLSSAQGGKAVGWFEPPTGGLHHKGARIGFTVLTARIDSWAEGHVLLFDLSARAVPYALGYLQRQACLHFVAAHETGDVVGFQECQNTFGFAELAGLCAPNPAGPDQRKCRQLWRVTVRF